MFRRTRQRISELLGGGRQPGPLESLTPEDVELLRRIRAENLTYLSEEKLASLAACCRDADASGMEGAVLEAGCALGGSAILLATIKNPQRPLAVYDVFGMIPAPSQADSQDVHERYRTIVEGKSEGLGGDTYYGYQEDLYDVVATNFERFGIDRGEQSVSLVKGLVQDTLHPDGPVALAHIDVDWYEPVLVCLQRIFPRLAPGGSIVIDDYHDWGGCRKATDEYLRDVVGQFRLDDSAGSLKVTRVST
jgi:asparagine synthase (glutamine-hydrolysing)